MGVASAKMDFEPFKTFLVRDALSGEELCCLDDVDITSTGLDAKIRIQRILKEKDVSFEPCRKRLLLGSTILCDHLTLQEVLEFSQTTTQLNPNELSVLNRPPFVQEWLQKRRQQQEWLRFDRRYNRYPYYFPPSLLPTGQSLNKPTSVRAFSDECDDIRCDLECAAAVVRDDGLILQQVSSELQDTEWLVLTAVKQNGLALQYASCRLQDSDLIVSAALKQNGDALQHASSRLQDIHPVVLAAVKQSGLALQYTSSRLKDNADIVWDAVKQNGLALQCASSRLKDEHQIAKQAVMQNGYALQYVSSRLQDDWSIVYWAFRQDTRAQQYASARIQARCAL